MKEGDTVTFQYNSEHHRGEALSVEEGFDEIGKLWLVTVSKPGGQGTITRKYRYIDPRLKKYGPGGKKIPSDVLTVKELLEKEEK